MKTSTQANSLSKELLEQIYAEVELRIENKFKVKVQALEERCARLEKRCAELEQERDTWKKKYFSEQRRAEKAEGLLGLAQEEIKALKAKIEEQEKKIAKLQHQLHSPKSESTSKASTTTIVEPKRSRGRQSGSKGHGRKSRTELPSEERISDFSVNERCCPSCQKPYEDFGWSTFMPLLMQEESHLQMQNHSFHGTPQALQSLQG